MHLMYLIMLCAWFFCLITGHAGGESLPYEPRFAGTKNGNKQSQPADTIAGPTTICPGQPHEYSATPGGHEYFLHWEVTGGIPAPENGPKVNVRWGKRGPYSIHAYRMTKAPPHRIVDTLQLNVNMFYPSDLPVNGPDTVCANGYASYNATFPEADHFEWTIRPQWLGKVITGNGTSSADIEWRYSGEAVLGTIRLRAHYCDITAQKKFNLWVKPATHVDLIAPDTGCAGTEQTFTAKGNIAGVAKWQWDFGDGTQRTTTTNKVSHAYSESGTHNVQVSALYDSTHCFREAEDAAKIFVHPQPVGNLSYDTLLCKSNLHGLRLYSSTHYPSKRYRHEWVHNGVNVHSGERQFLPSQEGRYSVMVTNKETGCQSMSNPVTIKNCPQQRVCQPKPHEAGFDIRTGEDCGSVLLDPHINGPGSDLLRWGYGDGATGMKNTHNYERSGIYPVTMHYLIDQNDGSGQCRLSFTKKATVPVKADFAAAYQCAVNDSLNMRLHDHSNFVGKSIEKWTWLNSRGRQIGSGPSPLVTLPTGRQMITLKVTTANSTCSVTRPVNVPQAGRAAFDGPSSICEDRIVDFANRSTGNIVSYWWDFGDNTSSRLANPKHKYGDVIATFSPMLITIDHYGCHDTVMQTLNVNRNNLRASINPAHPAPLAENESIKLNAHSSVTGAKMPLSYLWSTGDTTNTLTVHEPGSYSVTVEDGYGCRAYNPKPVNVFAYQLPKPVVIGETAYQLGDTVQLNMFNGASFEHTWYNEAGKIVSDSAIFEQPIQSAGVHRFIAELRSAKDSTYFTRDTIAVHMRSSKQ